MPKEESEALDVAEEIYQEPTTERQVSSFVTARRGEEIVNKEETQTVREDGSVVVISRKTIHVAACGKKLSSQDEIAGLCAVCNQAVCSEHAKYCVGYGGFPCNKLLCAKHTFYFPDENGAMLPCCLEHYEMKMYLQEDILAFDSEPEKKSKESKKSKEGE